METHKMEKLVPNYDRFKESEIFGKRLFNEVTFNPNKANLREEI